MFIGTDAPGYAAVAEGKPYIIVPKNCDIMLVILSMNFCSLSSIRFSLISSLSLSSFSACARFSLSFACAVNTSFTKEVATFSAR